MATIRDMGWRGIGWGLLALVSGGPAVAARPVIGQPAPDFTVVLPDHRRVTLADLRGQVVVLNFWATWCEPCKRELPLLDAAARQVGGRGLRIFAVTTEDSVPAYKLTSLAALVGFPLVRGIRGPYHPLEGVPTSYVIDRTGVLRYARADAFDLDRLNAVLVPLLNQPAPAAATP